MNFWLVLYMLAINGKVVEGPCLKLVAQDSNDLVLLTQHKWTKVRRSCTDSKIGYRDSRSNHEGVVDQIIVTTNKPVQKLTLDLGSQLFEATAQRPDENTWIFSNLAVPHAYGIICNHYLSVRMYEDAEYDIETRVWDETPLTEYLKQRTGTGPDAKFSIESANGPATRWGYYMSMIVLDNQKAQRPCWPHFQAELYE